MQDFSFTSPAQLWWRGRWEIWRGRADTMLISHLFSTIYSISLILDRLASLLHIIGRNFGQNLHIIGRKKALTIDCWRLTIGEIWTVWKVFHSRDSERALPLPGGGRDSHKFSYKNVIIITLFHINRDSTHIILYKNVIFATFLYKFQ